MTPSTRSISNTVLEVGKLRIPIAIHPGLDHSDVKFESASPAGNPVAMVPADTVTGELFDRDELRKGVFAAGEFKEVKPEAIDQVEQDVKLDTVRIERTRSIGSIPIAMVKGSYFVTTQSSGDLGARPLRTLRDAMKRSKLAGIGKITLRSRQHAFVLAPGEEDALTLTVLEFPDAVREAGPYVEPLDAVTVNNQLRRATGLMADLLKSMLDEDGTFLEQLRDDAIPARRTLYEKAVAGRPAKPRRSKSKRTRHSDDDVTRRLEQSLKQRKAPARV